MPLHWLNAIKSLSMPIRAESNDLHYQHINAALDHQPVMTMDDGADLVSEIHKNRPELVADMIGGTEETTTGVIRLRAMANEAAAQSDFIVTATGDKHVIDKEHLNIMKDGCVLANSGHFNVEINIPALEAMSINKQHPRPSIDQYTLADGRKLCLLAVNLAAAEGHPSTEIDQEIAKMKLSAMNIQIDQLTVEQIYYISSWQQAHDYTLIG